MPPRRRGPICIASNPDWCTTPGSTGVNDTGDTRNTVLINRTSSPQGVIRMAEGGAPVLAQKGGNATLPQPQKNTGKTIKLKMPKPASDNKSKCIRQCSWKLFGKTPQVHDVQQQTLMNCSLAGLLAALANTRSGQHFLQTRIKTHKANVETDFSGVATHLSAYCPKKLSRSPLKTKRYFAVSIEKKILKVSDALYTNEGAQAWLLIYMTSPKKVLWPIIIEKAYAKKVGDYGELDAAYAQHPISANDFWAQFCGSTPKVLSINSNTKRSQIRSIAKKAQSVPTVAVSKRSAPQVTGWHTFAILKLSQSKIKLYDPISAKEITLSDVAFRSNFKFALYGYPKK